ncbi:MAG: RNA methyltransferase [bacterium]
MRLIATTAPGLESLLADELRELDLENLEPGPGAVAFEGEWDVAARVLVRSRIASRLLLSIRRFAARSEAMLYDQTRRVPWPDHLRDGVTIAVFAHGSTAGTSYPLQFAALKIKDAICDEMRKLTGARPDVNRTRPDVRIEALFAGRRAELSIDLAGEPLHRRGWRLAGGEAPLRENRAAALVRLAAPTEGRTFVDPFCGSGTIAIEAALVATRRAPALDRALDSFACARLFPESRAAIAAEQARAATEVLATPLFPIRATDLDEEALAAARDNAARAKVAHAIEIGRADARELAIADALIVTNPPYGERVATVAEAMALITAFTRQLKHHAKGSRLALVLPQGPLETSVGLKPARRLAFSNGPIPSRLLVYELY